MKQEGVGTSETEGGKVRQASELRRVMKMIQETEGSKVYMKIKERKK